LPQLLGVHESYTVEVHKYTLHIILLTYFKGFIAISFFGVEVLS